MVNFCVKYNRSVKEKSVAIQNYFKAKLRLNPLLKGKILKNG